MGAGGDARRLPATRPGRVAVNIAKLLEVLRQSRTPSSVSEPSATGATVTGSDCRETVEGGLVCFRSKSPAVPVERIQPNAIGIVVGRPGRESEARVTMPAVRLPAVGVTSGAGFAKPGGPLESSHQPQLHTTPTVPSTILSRPAISGTGASRPGYAPAAIGAPAKTTAGISGTAFRAKH
jgi:hypothetical protein